MENSFATDGGAAMTTGKNIFEGSVPFNFLGLPPEKSDPVASRVAVLPVPYEGTAGGRPGARSGPASIIEASRRMSGSTMKPASIRPGPVSLPARKSTRG